MDAISIGAAGMTSAAQRFTVSAISAVSGSGDLAQNAVALSQAKTDFQASAEVVRTGDRMLGSLLDMKV